MIEISMTCLKLALELLTLEVVANLENRISRPSDTMVPFVSYMMESPLAVLSVGMLLSLPGMA